MQFYIESVLVPTLMVPFLSVRVTYNIKKVISMFSGDWSISLTLFQHTISHGSLSVGKLFRLSYIH